MHSRNLIVFLLQRRLGGCDWMSPDDEDPIEYFAACLDEQPSFLHWRDITRIACFGSEPDNLLMWSRYADGLRGLCLVFDDDELLEATLVIFMRGVFVRKRLDVAKIHFYAIFHDIN